jgi:methyl-accepting chemotaxis protein
MALNNNLSNTEQYNSNPEQQNLELDSKTEIVELLSLIRNTATAIGSVTGNFEKDFLAIGGKMQRFVALSKDLTADSSHITTVITESFLKNGISELNWLLSQFSEYLSKSVKDVGSETIELSRILEKIDSIIDNLVSFYKIVKQMRMLCISTKIESARLGNDDRGFNMLADNVEKLANFINNKVRAISTKANDLSKQIISSITKLGSLEHEQRIQADIILRNTNLTLSAFEDKYNKASAKSEEILLNSNDVLKTINNIVVLLQFHDINRQKLEHVSEALNRLAGELMQGGADETEVDFIAENYGLIHDVCELQLVQLKNARDEFVSAVFEIISNLENVGTDIDDIAEEIAEVLGEKTIFGKDSLDDVKKELLSIQKGLNKNGDIGKEIAISIKSVVDIVDDLTKDLLEIEEVGTEIELIALNAILKAARTGSEGAALGVLAESIQRLSFDAKSQTSLTSKILENISTTSTKLRENMDSYFLDDNADRFLNTNQKISDILQSIGKMGNDAGRILEKVNAGANGLKKEINSAVQSITIHETFQAKVSLFINQLTDIIDRIKRKNILKSNRKLHTDDLLKRYSMHSERTIHHNFIDNNTLKETKDSIYDDNVELF